MGDGVVGWVMGSVVGLWGCGGVMGRLVELWGEWLGDGVGGWMIGWLVGLWGEWLGDGVVSGWVMG